MPDVTTAGADPAVQTAPVGVVVPAELPRVKIEADVLEPPPPTFGATIAASPGPVKRAIVKGAVFVGVIDPKTLPSVNVDVVEAAPE